MFSVSTPKVSAALTMLGATCGTRVSAILAEHRPP